jgi:hypothetical protein
MATLLDKPERWRLRAEEMRKLAEATHDPEAKRLLLNLVTSYEKLAKRAEHRVTAAKR